MRNMQPKGKNSRFGDLAKWIVVISLSILTVFANFYFTRQPLTLRLMGIVIIASAILYIVFTTFAGKKVWVFLTSVRDELRKVVWPSRKETVQTTLVVIVIVVLFSAVMWGIDSLLAWFIGLFTNG